MTTYYVNSGATGTNSGADWTNAFNANPGAFAAALAAATTNGDIIKVHSAHVEEIAGDTTYTVGADISIISVDKDNSDALDPMGVDAWIGHSTGTAKYVEITGAFNVFMYGITFRNAGSTGTNPITLSKTDGSHYEYESCYFWLGNNAPDSIQINNRLDSQVFVRLKNCTLRFANSGSRLHSNGRIVLEGCSISSDGTAPDSLLQFSTADPSGGECTLIGCDLSHLGSGTLVADSTSQAATARFIQCKLGAAYTALAPAIATQTNLNRSSAEVYIFDCSTDGTSGLFGYFNAMGSVVSDTGIYFTSGAAAQSWKIVTTADCSFYTPFETPWLDYYNSTLSALTPYVEILRTGASGGTDENTAFDDDEVWCDMMAKTTSGSTISTLYTNRMTPLGTPAAQTTSSLTASDWTGELAEDWYGKLDVTFTPAEVGHIRCRVCVGIETTLYLDPQVRV